MTSKTALDKLCASADLDNCDFDKIDKWSNVIRKDLKVLEQLEILKEYYEPFKTFLNDMFEKGHNTDLNKIKEWLEK